MSTGLPSAKLPSGLRPLRHRSYRLLAASLTLSLLGAGLVIVSLAWQVVALGGGPADLSLVTGAEAAGLLVTALIGGVLADRIPQRRLLMTAQATKATGLGVAAALSLAGVIQLWQLAAVALVSGIVDGIYYPAYSALLPALVPEGELLAANGLEGVLRPMLMQAIGPAAAGLIVGTWSPGAALAVTATVVAGAVAWLVVLPSTPVRRDNLESSPTLAHLRRDLLDGFAYLWRTPWLRATLAFASLLVLLIMGPLDVLLPFVIKGHGGGPTDHALVLAAFGVGGGLGAAAMASARLPRRYLTVMNLMWGLGCLPMAGVGLTSSVWVMAAGAFVVGAAFEGATVIWGTLLQRRVPPELLGRVSSLDFFVSLAFMPVSMAMAGPVSAGIGMNPTFLLAGLVPAAFAVVAIVAARMPADELAHPLR